MIEFREILIRLKEYYNLKNDKEIALKIGVEQQNITNWKNRNKIPYEELISLCLKENINIKYILTGDIEKKTINYKEELQKTIEKLNDNDLKSVYHFAKSKEV